MTTHVERMDSTELGRLANQWNGMSQGVPFRSFEWLESWWRQYQQPGRSELYTLAVVDERQALIGIAPWYVERSKTRGKVLRFLSSGEVCSDYLGLLCGAENQAVVVETLAEWLTSASNDADHGWDLLELSGVDAEDPAIRALLEALSARGNAVHMQPAPQCWRIELPSTWDEYVASLSKSHRKQVRRLERNDLESGRAVFHRVNTADDLDRALPILIDLHQRRRQSLGEPGCFSSPRFAAFQREVISRLLAGGRLRLGWLELEGKPVAVEYHLAEGGVVYAYQSGVEPAALDAEPGRLAAIATIRGAIEGGCTGFDFLRGDEPYKAHWRAVPRPLLHAQVLPSHAGARLRHCLWSAGGSMKGWIKEGLDKTGLRKSSSQTAVLPVESPAQEQQSVGLGSP